MLEQLKIGRDTAYRWLRLATIDDGLLTTAERDLICRTGTRKSGYWARHVRNLLEVLAERQRQRGSMGSRN